MCNEPRAEGLGRVRELLERRGWTYIHSSDASRRVYSVGLVSELDHPEIMICGLSPDEARRWLTTLRDHIRLGVRYDSQAEYELLGRRAMILPMEASAAASALPVAHLVHGERFKAVQLVVADDGGHFPWTRAGAIPQSLFSAVPALH